MLRPEAQSSGYRSWQNASASRYDNIYHNEKDSLHTCLFRRGQALLGKTDFSGMFTAFRASHLDLDADRSEGVSLLSRTRQKDRRERTSDRRRDSSCLLAAKVETFRNHNFTRSYMWLTRSGDFDSIIC